MSLTYYLMPETTVKTLDVCLDLILKEQGVAALRDVNALVFEMSNNVAEIRDNNDKVIGLSDLGVEYVKSLVDVAIRKKGVDFIQQAAEVLGVFTSEVDISHLQNSEAVVEPVNKQDGSTDNVVELKDTAAVTDVASKKSSKTSSSSKRKKK